jgi:hypothetical protein
MDDRDMDRLHDVLVEVNGRSYSEAQLKAIYLQLPETIRNDIRSWGLDTVIADNIYNHMKRHGVPTV